MTKLRRTFDRYFGTSGAILVAGCVILVPLLSGCTQEPVSCLQLPPADLSGALAWAEDEQLPFRFPLDELGRDTKADAAIVCTYGVSGSLRQYHAAEDYHLPPGSPVYAMADGVISFSGPKGGYGWLVIIDHPEANIYSLYGHLSPSRWSIEPGPVERGDLIGYLGDPDENGGTPEEPLRPHLHFAIRAGQRADYPAGGEWRWMAGWIAPCPRDVGWLPPSEIMTSQQIPPGGFQEPPGRFFQKWGFELALLSVYLFGAAFVLVFAVAKRKPFAPVVYSAMLLITGVVLLNKGTRASYALFLTAAVLIMFSIARYLRRRGRVRHPMVDNT
jgi:murein DD-endopeptidase MepM/ murein hydrolase activator NlpD